MPCGSFIALISILVIQQKTAYERRISDLSSDVCSSDLREHLLVAIRQYARFVVTGQSVRPGARQLRLARGAHPFEIVAGVIARARERRRSDLEEALRARDLRIGVERLGGDEVDHFRMFGRRLEILTHRHELDRSAEHTSALQSLMRISYAVFCLKKK